MWQVVLIQQILVLSQKKQNKVNHQPNVALALQKHDQGKISLSTVQPLVSPTLIGHSFLVLCIQASIGIRKLTPQYLTPNYLEITLKHTNYISKLLWYQ